MPTSVSFDQAAYWIKRHRDFRDDPRSVGNMAASKQANEEGQAVIAGIVREATALARVPKSVLDAGCGYGRITSSFVDNGYDYTGIDVSPEAIAEARRRFPGLDFVVGDLSSWQPPRRYGLVSFVYVFVHFVDDLQWETVLRRALSWIEPGGALLFADQLGAQRLQVVDHVVVRPLASYIAVFDELSFELDGNFRTALAGRCNDSAMAPPHLIGQFHLARQKVLPQIKL